MNQIYITNVDGSGLTPVTHNDAFNSYRATWSPDGRRLAFAAFDTSSIYVIGADGSAQTLISTDRDAEPAWSPDGDLIAFSSRRDGASHIYVMNADGTGQTALASNAVANDWGPAWR